MDGTGSLSLHVVTDYVAHTQNHMAITKYFAQNTPNSTSRRVSELHV